MSAGLLFCVVARAAAPEFEVATVKAAAQPTPELFMSGKIHIGMTVDGARVDIGGMGLSALLMQAFRVKAFQVTAPDWALQSRWDILAKIPEGASKDQVPEMLKSLLADRFKLVFHRETKELPVYSLVVAKGGPRMKVSEDAPGAADEPANGAFGFLPPPGRGGPGRGPGEGPGPGSATIAISQFGKIKISGSPQEGRMHLEASKVSMPALADLLTGMTDRPVLDMTGLAGNFQVTLDVSIEEMFGGMARSQGLPMPAGGRSGPGGFGGPGGGQAEGASDPSGNQIFGSVAKLGLKLEPTKAPIDTIVVDHLEKAPTEN